MRRKISLYIADRLVDLDDQSLILFNYTMEDLTNPTIVKNSYSHQVTLKGTPNNNRLFGDIFRLDRMVAYNGGQLGTDFNPSKKTPFKIYNELNEVIESGYCKLDSVNLNKRVKEYNISLFGGLGSFIYSLAYDAEGNKRTLADLDYLGTDNPVNELDFVINTTNVQEAWNTEAGTGEIDDKWKVINFAPAYNGIPEGNFSADKAIVVPSSVGLSNSLTKDGVNYHDRGNYAIVNLKEKHDEWSVKDLRSYLQRPVFSMRAFLNAISKPSNNGGYVVNMPFMDKYDLAPYVRTWMTLPMIPSLGTIKQATGDLTLTMSSTPSSGHVIGRYDVGGSVSAGTRISTNVNLLLQSKFSGIADNVLYRSIKGVRGKQSVIFIQVVAYSADDSVVGGSKVKSIYDWNLNPSDMAQRCGYNPPFMSNDTFEPDAVTEDKFNKVGTAYQFAKGLSFNIECQDVSYYLVHVTTYYIETYNTLEEKSITRVTGGNTSVPTLFRDYETSFYPTQSLIVNGSMSNSISYTSAESLRSGAVITKTMLLSTSQTPADYLLSFCKIFGLHLLFDKSNNEITIIDRTDLYQDETIDLTRRVDLSKPIGITPFVFDSKWYDMRFEGVGGSFMEEYKSTYGMDYGIKRINTGYDFNADVKNLMDGNVFKNAVTILDKSRYYNTIKVNGQVRPSVFLDQGNTYTLWSDTGETLDTDIPVPPYSAVVEFFNEYNNGYDAELARKMEFRTADNKPVDGSGVLVFWEGMQSYEYFNLSDDIPSMDLLNDGTPCWILTPASQTGITIPVFQRYLYTNNHRVDDSLDFGVPKELDIPNLYYSEDKTIYAKFWRDYLRDRYDINTKVMTCKVNFGGMQVGQELLRKFYWFDNALWVLNKISNHSLTTFDPVDCEFVQVQEKGNYINIE